MGGSLGDRPEDFQLRQPHRHARGAGKMVGSVDAEFTTKASPDHLRGQYAIPPNG